VLADDSALVDPCSCEHFLLQFNNKSKRDEKVIKFINEGLARNQLCVYAVVNQDQETMSRLSSGITNYQTNFQEGNLMIVDFSSYYQSGVEKYYRPFAEFAEAIMFENRNRDDRYIRLVCDCAPAMFADKHLEEFISLEQWWQKKPFHGSILCPLDISLFDEMPYKDYEKACMHYHDKVLFC
jgi:hypothetical protein